MTFRAHMSSGRTVDFNYGYDATALVRAEAERLTEGDETVTDVTRVLTLQQQKDREAVGFPRRR